MDAQRVLHRCLSLARCTEEPGHITRTFLSPPMRQVHHLVGPWMAEAGMSVRVDAVGNIRGVWGDGPRLMLASHLDTVPHAGAYDGILGVMMAIELAAAKPPISLEVVGFSEEEGVRFGMPFIGSRALVGDPVMDPEVLEAIRAFGLDPAQIPQAAIGQDVNGYLEFHIEQGPVLEQNGLALGVVERIVPQARAEVEFVGKAGHAGATPMRCRADALAAAAEWIALVERTAIEQKFTATVGRLEVKPGAVNVIPGSARATLDVRDANAAVEILHRAAEEIARRRHISIRWETKSEQPAVIMDAPMTNVLADAVQALGHRPFRLPSGAGHDAMILARKVRTAMLFLRSPGGVSHHPDERVGEEDVAAALDVGVAFLKNWRPV